MRPTAIERVASKKQLNAFTIVLFSIGFVLYAQPCLLSNIQAPQQESRQSNEMPVVIESHGEWIQNKIKQNKKHAEIEHKKKSTQEIDGKLSLYSFG